MGKIDKQKETRIFKNSDILEGINLIVLATIVLLITIALIYANKVILNKIDKLEDM